MDLDEPPSWPAHAHGPSSSPIERVAFSPDGTRLLVPLPTGFIQEIDIVTGEVVSRWRAHDGLIHSVDIRCHDGLLATADAEGVIRLWKFDDSACAAPTADRSVTEAFLRSTNLANRMKLWSDLSPSEEVEGP